VTKINDLYNRCLAIDEKLAKHCEALIVLGEERLDLSEEIAERENTAQDTARQLRIPAPTPLHRPAVLFGGSVVRASFQSTLQPQDLNTFLCIWLQRCFDSLAVHGKVIHEWINTQGHRSGMETEDSVFGVKIF
jgi:hypothetical protein